MAWQALSDVVPLYPLYALLFADAGMSVGQISALFAIWSIVGILAEVPCGALADRFSRRGALVVAGLVEAAAFALWIVFPGFGGFAAGFVLWGLGGALASGALEALVYDGLAAAGAESRFAHLNGRITAAGLLAQIPAGLAATALFALGGYGLVVWASVACCLATAVLASRLPEPPRHPGEEGDDGDDLGYLATLRLGLSETAARPALAAAVLVVAALGGVDAVEEYFPLLTADLGFATAAVPVAMIVISVAGAAGAALGGAASRLPVSALGVLLAVAAGALAVAGLVRHPAALAGIAVFYGVLRLVLVVVQARLQERIRSSARATVTSVAGFGTEIVGLAMLGVWTAGGAVLVAGVVLVLAVALAPALRARVAR
ncbi:MAG TPA: MFS transporter [Pseudonocardia sp.]|nr:MFS transporter [Pseudonocardia sp.]